ncbi:MAG: hypothetical protein V3R49_02740, partial [Gammaproteobacteria bacterium]
SRYSNVPTGLIVDPIIRLFAPGATGIIDSLAGLDDGSNTIDGQTVLISEYYSAKDYQRVVLCNNPDPTLGSIREVQQVTSWADGEIQFTLDGMRIDPANCWAIAFDAAENILATLMIGSPTAVFQSIKRLTAGDGFQSAIYLNSTWNCSSPNFEFECDFLLKNAICDTVNFLYDGFVSRIEYYLATSLWEMEFSDGTTFTIASTKGGLDDGLAHTLKVVTDTGSVNVYIDGVLDASDTGVVNNATCGQLVRPDGGTAGVLKAYVWNVKLTDISTPSNSKYWKFNEQLDGHFYNYAQDADGVEEIGAFNFDRSFEYLPGEGY